MENISRIFGFLVLGIFLWVGSATADSTTVMDNYFGGDDHGYGDVIGDSGTFDIEKAVIDLTGTELRIDIHTNFAGLGNEGIFSNYTVNNKGIGYGDLFLGNSWTPYGSKDDHYIDDNHESGTTWTYGFVLDDRYRVEEKGIGTLYRIANKEGIQLSDDLLTGATYRNGQEVTLDPTGQELIKTGSWDTTAGIVSFIIDIEGTELQNWEEIAFHWGETCGNDTIEGSAAPVPEPATMFLFGTGLIGMATVGRKKFRK